MPRSLLRWSALFMALSLSACDDAPRFTQAEPGEARSGGEATVRKSDQNAFSMPSANLSPTRRLDFSVGNSFFRSPWVIAPSTTTARDGLGPLFNTNGCQNCHIKDGRGHPPTPDSDNAVSMLVRLSIPNEPAYAKVIEQMGIVPEPVYGGQFQDMAVPGVAPEGKVRVEYEPLTLRFKDGSEVELRKPKLQITQLGYGPMHPDTRFSARVAPPMIGLGLLEAIPEAAILANAQAQAKANNGIAGRPNRVWDDAQQKTVLGRFGWKAGQPNLNQQNVHAFSGDMGLTTRLRPFDDCTDAQTACKQAPNGNGPDGEPEVSDNILRLVLFYSRNLGVPARRDVGSPQVLAGKNLFYQAGCQSCHTPQFTTAADAAEPELANQVIRPYSDLLLHDMGEGLADNRSEFQAGGRDWRTPPLWGIGLTQTVSGHTQFLHDGRARNLLEAVLWHGGEAQAAQQQVLSFNAEQRAALLAFLNSL
ncbi:MULTISPECIES: di-heme oxidoreductase family protein [Pseudomonas]|uniref:di-heme oxidoreductase family protein n=1 Tax=Pseudomonas TaxID=286 RepID=UPI0007B32C2B|nr:MULTISPECIES: di-heme oxidoredictase family protein [Pseudomonas]AZC52867.1 putative thiol oxidoreductase [Pseudomonas chlororaphis subsp. piscium]AZC59124.1 putative thiol oxidoreductase [Pseudomonas chlororaphis subsp. piscium]AZC65335.1 putative thiol oxidoreductase [Pseudomonas chlororaphis subsp. piscium]AZC71575.1 putative thiol oxidoreductase [Pseudomonas chlororaphis subsp. piscium]AZC77808.1 putative thiol oxidoreductase [Pseudomonas chlororaphis subsp. piscium]